MLRYVTIGILLLMLLLGSCTDQEPVLSSLSATDSGPAPTSGPTVVAATPAATLSLLPTLLPVPTATVTRADAYRILVAQTGINKFSSRDGMILIGIDYDASMVNFDEIRVNDAAIFDKENNQIGGGDLRVGMQIYLVASYFEEPYDEQPYTLYALRIFETPDEYFEQFGRGQ